MIMCITIAAHMAPKKLYGIEQGAHLGLSDQIPPYPSGRQITTRW